MFYLKLENGFTFRMYDQAQDVQVLSDNASTKEQWFSIHTHKQESFKQACDRLTRLLENKYNSGVLVSF